MRDQELGDLAPAHATRHPGQSPSRRTPKSTAALASAGCLSTSSRTRFTSPCDTPTVSLTTAGILARAASWARLHSPAEAAGHAPEPSNSTPTPERNPRRFTLIVASALVIPKPALDATEEAARSSQARRCWACCSYRVKRGAPGRARSRGGGRPRRAGPPTSWMSARSDGARATRHPEVRVVVEADQVHHQPDSRVVILDLPDDEVPLGFPPHGLGTAMVARHAESRRVADDADALDTEAVSRSTTMSDAVAARRSNSGRPVSLSNTETATTGRGGTMRAQAVQPTAPVVGTRAVGAPPTTSGRAPADHWSRERRGCHCRTEGSPNGSGPERAHSSQRRRSASSA